MVLSTPLSNTEHKKDALGVALLGAGTVGNAVIEFFVHQSNHLESLCQRQLYLTHIIVRDVDRAKKKLHHFGDSLTNLISNDWHRAVCDDETDLVIELMGGQTTARDSIRTALAAQKPIITANKALLAETTTTIDDILALADNRQLSLSYEAAVAGGIPIVRILQNALVGDRIYQFYGIINGTCNYMLSTMAQQQLSFDQALSQAQSQGYAEADPTLDIDGGDSAHKLLLATALAFGVRPKLSDIPTMGIVNFDSCDITFARQFKFCIKLLAIAKIDEMNRLQLRVRPTLLPENSILANVDGAMNAIMLRSDLAGETLYYGAGAGAKPSAASVIADLINTVRHYDSKQLQLSLTPPSNTPPTLTTIFSSSYYLRLRVSDDTGVIASIAGTLANYRISIELIYQNPLIHNDNMVDVVIFTHTCLNDDINAAVHIIAKNSFIQQAIVVLPIEKLT